MAMPTLQLALILGAVTVCASGEDGAGIANAAAGSGDKATTMLTWTAGKVSPFMSAAAVRGALLLLSTATVIVFVVAVGGGSDVIASTFALQRHSWRAYATAMTKQKKGGKNPALHEGGVDAASVAQQNIHDEVNQPPKHQQHQQHQQGDELRRGDHPSLKRERSVRHVVLSLKLPPVESNDETVRHQGEGTLRPRGSEDEGSCSGNFRGRHGSPEKRSTSSTPPSFAAADARGLRPRRSQQDLLALETMSSMGIVVASHVDADEQVASAMTPTPTREAMPGAPWFGGGEEHVLKKLKKSSSVSCRSTPTPADGSHYGGVGGKGDVVDDHTMLSWAFDAFDVAERSNGAPLRVVATYALERRGIVAALDLDRVKLAKFLATVERLYEPTNGYHTAVHAADVVQTLTIMLCACDDDEYDDQKEEEADEGGGGGGGGGLARRHGGDVGGTRDDVLTPRRRFTPLEELAVLLAAVIHDVAHPGVSNVELTTRRHALATAAERESCRSVAESFSAAIGSNLLGSVHFDFLGDSMSTEARLELEELTTSLVLITDIASDNVTMPRARELMRLREVRERERGGGGAGAGLETSPLLGEPQTRGVQVMEAAPEWERLTLLSVLLKAADVGHLYSSRDVHVRWVRCLHDEIFLKAPQEHEYENLAADDDSVSGVGGRDGHSVEHTNDGAGADGIQDRSPSCGHGHGHGHGPPPCGGHLEPGSEEAARSWNAFCDGQVGFFDAYALPLFGMVEALFGTARAPMSQPLELAKENRAFWAERAGVVVGM